MARDGRKFGKDPRDRARHQRAQRGGFRPVTGGAQRAATVRVASNAKRGTKTVTREDRYDLRVPNGLGDRVYGIHVKVDVVREYDATTNALLTERATSPKLVIVFREHQQGIRGMPVPRAVANKLRKCSFTHAVIQRIPVEARTALAGPQTDAYDERAFRLTCYAPKGGHRYKDVQGGEVVHDVTDELSVLQFLYEHDLPALYEVPHLASRGFLPMRDEDRIHEDAVITQFQIAFGASGDAHHPQRAFHWARLHHRLVIVHGGESAAADVAFAATVRGRQFSSGDAAVAAVNPEMFYVSDGLALAYAVYAFPSFRAVVSYDIAQRTIVAIEPIMQDVGDCEVLGEWNAAFLRNPNYRRVSWGEFRALVGGIGSAIAAS